MLRFQSQTVIITGGAKGIGAGCAKVFAAAGGNIGLLDLDNNEGEKLSREIQDHSAGDACFINCDVANFQQFNSAIEQVAARFGDIHCLINNAGIHPPALTIEATSLAELERVLQINFVSTFTGCQLVLPYLRKTRGTIVNISSMTAILGQEHSTAYSASKGAQVSLTKSLAIELGAAGIRVNAILPSNVDTPLMRSWAATLADPESALERVAKLQVLGRMATPEEIGKTALFLATDESSFITGQALIVDGGASLDY